MKRITFDVMLNERFVCTMRIPLTFDMIDGYEGDDPVINLKAIEHYIEEKRPSLKGKEYRICF